MNMDRERQKIIDAANRNRESLMQEMLDNPQFTEVVPKTKQFIAFLRKNTDYKMAEMLEDVLNMHVKALNQRNPVFYMMTAVICAAFANQRIEDFCQLLVRYQNIMQDVDRVRETKRIIQEADEK